MSLTHSLITGCNMDRLLKELSLALDKLGLEKHSSMVDNLTENSDKESTSDIHMYIDTWELESLVSPGKFEFPDTELEEIGVSFDE